MSEYQAQQLDAVVSGMLVLPGEQPVKGSVGVVNGRIVAIGDRATLGEARAEYEYGDFLILPGVVDVHFHSLGYAGEGFVKSTRGAAAGGVTTVNDHPFLDLGGAPTTSRELIAKSELMEQQVFVDFALSGGVVSGKLENIVEAAQNSGVAAFKALMHSTAPREWYGIWALEDWELFEGFRQVAATGLPCLVHAENDNIITYLAQSLQQCGRIDPAAHHESRPDFTELEAVSRALILAQEAGVHLHLVHVSLPQSFELATRARAAGAQVTGETCPHFLILNNERWQEVGMLYKINPPLRSEEARQGLWDALVQGKIQLISSDHAPRDEVTSDVVFENPSGTPGVETMLPLMFSEGVVGKRISIGRLVELMSANPAKLLGIYPQKGTISIGSDADLVVIDPKQRWIIEGSKLQTGCKLTAFEGIEVTGRPISTFVRGQQVYCEGEFLVKSGFGRFVPRLGWLAKQQREAEETEVAQVTGARTSTSS